MGSLAIHTTAWPKHPNEPIPCKEMEGRNKLLAETKLEEPKIILRWHFEFQRLIISLPENKFIAWTDSFKDTLSRGTSTAKELETTIGRLGHLGTIVPFVNHFCSWLQDLQRQATRHRAIHISQPCMDDLHTMLFFLEKAYKGIDMNIISFRHPTHTYRSNLCPFGLRRLFPQRFLFEIQNPRRSPIQGNQQPLGIHGIHNNAMGGHNSTMSQKGRLHPLHDQQYDISRMDNENKIQRNRRRSS
jgi:hypothetical protein